MQGQYRDRLLNTGIVLSGALLLSSHALYNGFPLLYSDTGTYIAACMDGFIPRDRPLTYSYFIRHLSLKETLWIPMFLQCILVSWLTWMAFRHFTQVKRTWPWHLGTLACLSFTTGVAAITCLMIPDLFTPVIVLAGALLLFGKNIGKKTRIFLFVLIAYATTTHLSHYPLLCALIATLFVVWFIRRKREGARALLVNTGVLAATIPLAILITMLMNYSVGGRWQFSPGSGHVFMMNRLIQCGIVNDYLDEICPTRYTTMCVYRPQPGQDFLWDPNSPLNIHYHWEGWENAKPEYDSIISDIFSQPKYLKRYIASNIHDATVQLYTMHITPIIPLLEGQAVHDQMHVHFPGDHRTYLRSRQANGKMNMDVINSLQVVVISVALVALLLILSLRRFRNRMSLITPLSLWLLAAIIFNALTVVSVAMIDSRYQSRVIWLLPLLLICYLAETISAKNNTGNTP